MSNDENLSPDHARVKTPGMAVKDATGNIGIVRRIRYTGDARVCHVQYVGRDKMEWWPGRHLTIPTFDEAQGVRLALHETTDGKARRAEH